MWHCEGFYSFVGFWLSKRCAILLQTGRGLVVKGTPLCWMSSHVDQCYAGEHMETKDLEIDFIKAIFNYVSLGKFCLSWRVSGSQFIDWYSQPEVTGRKKYSWMPLGPGGNRGTEASRTELGLGEWKGFRYSERSQERPFRWGTQLNKSVETELTCSLQENRRGPPETYVWSGAK